MYSKFILMPFILHQYLLLILRCFLVYAVFQNLNASGSRDYSYGIYLYGYPIIQALVACIPELRGHGALVFVLAAACTMAFAAMSWHLIERRALALKSQLPAGMTARRAAEPRLPARLRRNEGGSDV